MRSGLYGYCRRLAGNVWDAEDLVQDTILRAFGQWGVSYGSVRDPRAYLLRTATNVWIDAVRKRQTEARTAAEHRRHDAAAPALPPDAASDPRAAGAQLLQRLSSQERAAVVLKEVFDMTLDEIAGLLATTTGAVKAAPHRGRERLHDREDAPPSRRPVFRFGERAGRIARIRSFAFCPETIHATGEALGLRVRTGLYRAPTLAPGPEWPEPAASQ